MKKFFTFCLLFALVCAVLAGCTPPEADSETDVSLPSLEDQTDSAATQTDNNNETLNSIADSEAMNTTSERTDASSEAPVVSEEDPEAESMSEIIVDGGDGFGVGGN